MAYCGGGVSLNFIHVAKNLADKFNTVLNLEISIKALYLLAGPSTDDDVRGAVLEHAEEGNRDHLPNDCGRPYPHPLDAETSRPWQLASVGRG